MKNFIQNGDTIEVASAAADVVSGQVVVIGSLIAIANHPAKTGESFTAKLTGVFEVPKATGAAWTQGQPLMWDASANAFAGVGTPAAGDVTGAGVAAFAAAGSSDAKGLVRLAGIPGTVTSAGG